MQYANTQHDHLVRELRYTGLAPVTGRKSASPLKHDIIGDSDAILQVMKLVAQVASSQSSVLLLGETGTGKELIAEAIHRQSERRDRPMIKVNCGALPANLIESELFGHERGSFTGAIERRIGKFEMAQRSTLFLDEIGEMPPELQVKLLRVLQEKEFERIGGKTSISADVRIIAATNRNLENEILAGRFRIDLFYRLNVFPITLPALRERRTDIPALANYFLSRYCAREKKMISHIPPGYLYTLMNYHWPGNIRELENIIARSVLLSGSEDLIECPVFSTLQNNNPPAMSDTIKTITQNEIDHILKALSICNNKIHGPGGAAALLHINASTLLSRMKKLGIKRKFSA
ncbi:sigma-54 interaction domain-containing protein [Chitinophaga agri]|uniref:AAA domain-containing protein n=1 Tax=Chitinophaga agri TaxID=2703787 RepID=A0A6B9ZBJ2_9BACT|nr:sigma 54-interacting transcriptional regulator [Chitinophaga agri]QHS59680.1 AAA domain-containing protein [Chitinophaga agri]